MRIQLKQDEIEAAIRSYLTGRGIATQNKSVEMTFTSGRKNKGLSADVMIEDKTEMTDGPAPVMPEAPVNTLVQESEVAPTAVDTDASAPMEIAPAEAAILTPTSDEDKVTEGVEGKATVGSLFG